MTLKASSVAACLASVERLFQIFDPQNEQHFCPVEELFKGSLKSVDVFRRLREMQSTFLVKNSLRYLGARSLRHVKTVSFDCLSINCPIVCQPKLCIKGLLGGTELTISQDTSCSVLKSLQL